MGVLSALDGWRIMVQITIYYYVHDIVYISKFHTITFGVLDTFSVQCRCPKATVQSPGDKANRLRAGLCWCCAGRALAMI